MNSIKMNFFRPLLIWFYWLVAIIPIYAFIAWATQYVSPVREDNVDDYFIMLRKVWALAAIHVTLSRLAYVAGKSVFLTIVNKAPRWTAVVNVAIALAAPFLVALLVARIFFLGALMLGYIGILGYILIVPFAIFGVGMGIRINWREAKQQLLQAEKLNAVTQMELLKAQTSPHFLFNTINNIDALILKDPEKASVYLNKLSGLLRFMLYESATDRVPLATEIRYIAEYIGLQQIRSLNPDFVQLHTTGQMEQLSIAPMIFLPIIENAFKHLPGKTLTNAIAIHVNMTANEIEFVCRNIYQPGKTVATESGGIGMRLITQRLDLIYPQKHELKIDKDDQYFTVQLKMKLDAA
ncbi:sensor histidine kinase [Chitinophaga sp. Cy-1792]|uniref:sensor histidine kinase n=1 Tax=Chitinophaga sp. Cy-1792 TaxID=2608339 RepID=UPI0014204DAD|nr:sensor histidine kinase [Chitinophaga sp. Cy-1792]NIG57519.1 hypothetical protein [Chitinophaga sp. Cy-1792]